MRVYLACGSVPPEAECRWRAAGLWRRLYSYLALRRGEAVAQLPSGLDLFLDSGAFSAWSKGVRIDLDAYADFITRTAGTFTVVASLDVIPGSPGQEPSSSEVERAAQEGWENWETLSRKVPPSVTLLHTYHRGENVRWLRRLMDAAPYFGLGGLARVAPTARRAYLDEIMPRLTDREGKALRKFHGFGLTAVSLMTAYPWESCDSTSWSHAARYGWLFTGLDDRMLNVSDAAVKSRPHVRETSEPERAEVRRWLEARGLTLEELALSTTLVHEANIRFFAELEHRIAAPRWRREQAQRAFF